MPKLLLSLLSLLPALLLASQSKPNVILIYADDISAREFSIYGSDTWSPPDGGDSSNPAYLGSTPVLDRLATGTNGVYFTQAWAATVCSPSRAMMMTGRYAHRHKWWHNGDLGTRLSDGGVWPINESSDFLISHVAGLAGYASMWCGKTQMKATADLLQFGFDEGVFTPGGATLPANTNSDFRIEKVGGIWTNLDTNQADGTYATTSWYWKPSVALMNHPEATTAYEYWQDNPYDVNTWGPDVELDFILDFIDRKHAENKPFFVYHTTHLGHGQFNFIDPTNSSSMVGTPVINWNPETSTYTRTPPSITGDNGVYDLSSITAPGMQAHVEYLDYQVWQYLEKLKELGIENETILIFCADNGTHGYGKASHDRQKGTHVPLIIYAPGEALTKQGRQEQLASMADILPTLQDIMGVRLPASYEIHGESMWPYLTTAATKHRDWIYAYKEDMQLIRGSLVMKDGSDKWWDVSGTEPSDLISYPQITDWTVGVNGMTQAHVDERDALLAELPQFDLHSTEHDEPQPIVPQGPGGETQMFAAVQDADVKSGAADSNFNVNFLKIAGSQPRYGYLQFDLSGLTDPIVSAKLWVRNYSGTSMNGTLSVFAAANDWDESTVTWNTKPAGDATSVINSVSMSVASEWYAIDVSSYITAAQLYTLGLNSDASDPLGLIYSKEGGSAAYLELELDGENANYDPFSYWMYQNGLKYTDWDDDGDAVFNEDEYVTGSDPNDVMSVYRIDSIGLPDGDFQIRFDTIVDRSYTVQWKNHLMDTTWNELTGAIGLVGTGNALEIVDDSGAGARFYRVMVEVK